MQICWAYSKLQETISYFWNYNTHCAWASTRCTWAGGTYVNYHVFCENHKFHVIYCVTIPYVLYLEEFLIHDSCQSMIFKINLLGLCHFPLNT